MFDVEADNDFDQLFGQKADIYDESLHETWWVLDAEESGLSDIMKQADDSLDQMFDDYGIFPIKYDSGQKIYNARFEFIRYDKKLQYPDARFPDVKKCLGWVDFLCGMPSLGAAEMMAVIGEHSSKSDLESGYVAAIKATGQDISPPFPEELFEGYRDSRILSNYLYIADPGDAKDRDTLVDGVAGESEPAGLHWWSRINLQENATYPLPGEFFGLAVRHWLELPWGEQESSPYFFSGHWMDTVFYTSAKVLEVQEPTDDFPYNRYTVKWRKHTIENVCSTDFNIYAVDDRVTILKDVATEKQSQLWKDEDMKTFNTGTDWVIAPVQFYGISNSPEE